MLLLHYPAPSCCGPEVPSSCSWLTHRGCLASPQPDQGSTNAPRATSTRRDTLAAVTSLPERITAAAILLKNGKVISVPPPARHPSVILLAQQNGWTLSGATQGFVTCIGRFVDRRKAWVIAENAGQLLPKERGGCVPRTLYSEDVW